MDELIAILNEFRADVALRLDGMQTQINGMQTQVNELQTGLARVEAQGAAIGFELKNDVRAVANDVRELTEKVEQYEFDALRARLQSIQNRDEIRIVERRISVLEDKLAA